ncbi:hypothetical protein T484DRAFT_1798295 [Baffinella frigidus]|nr:hypothetical protein T484DRAFT_1798295 [Cryptophyta sp. CCMP2293]
MARSSRSAVTATRPTLISLIGLSFSRVYKPFDAARFAKAASHGLDDKTMVQRAKHMADAMASELPARFEDACPILLAALGPESTPDDEAAWLRYKV